MNPGPNIGYYSGRDYFVGPVNVAYDRFKKVSNRENAISAATALWELHDWAWRDTNAGASPKNNQSQYNAFRAALFANCPDLELIRDIAESAKHAGVDRPSVKVKEIGGSGSPGGKAYVSSPFGTDQLTPECRLEIELHNGSKRSLPEVLQNVMEFWRRNLV